MSKNVEVAPCSAAAAIHLAPSYEAKELQEMSEKDLKNRLKSHSGNDVFFGIHNSVFPVRDMAVCIASCVDLLGCITILKSTLQVHKVNEYVGHQS